MINREGRNQYGQGMTERDEYGNQIDPSRRLDDLNDSIDVASLPPTLYMWRINNKLGDRIIMPADTMALNFQNTNLVEGMTGHYNYLGNLGTPRLSRFYFERTKDEPTIFMAPYSIFYQRPEDVNFTNSNVPFSNLTYYTAGNKIDAEELFKSYFSVNVNKQLAFGFQTNYLYGRGFYANQSTGHFNAGIFASYIGDKYQMQFIYNNYTLRANENGGITDDRYITRPEALADGKKSYDPANIPVRLESTANRNSDFYVYLTHRYRLGFTRTTERIQDKKQADTLARKIRAKSKPKTSDEQEKDTDIRTTPDNILGDTLTQSDKDTIVIKDFVPVTSFIHTFKIERARHKFRSSGEPQDMYEQSFLSETASRDSTQALKIDNTFGIALLEGFNKYAKAGLTAYLSHRVSRYNLMNLDLQSDRTIERFTEQELYIGGELAKKRGKAIRYNITGEVGLLDKAAGQFNVTGDLNLRFKFLKDSIHFNVGASINNTLPSFYMRHYRSNHFAWDNDEMEKELRTRIQGELAIPTWGTNLKVFMENIKNYTYFNHKALPTQEKENIQVISAVLTQNFCVGIFHLDNEVIWQKSSNENSLPLPAISTYNNLYIIAKLAKKVLTLQLGADMRYFTKYYAPGYCPAIQQFHIQDEVSRVEIGNYPVISAYANFHLKRTRFFVMMSHVNCGMGNSNYFYVPHYPLNQGVLKMGISWNFYD